eukprot:4527291-Amphidinium_carterae.2
MRCIGRSAGISAEPLAVGITLVVRGIGFACGTFVLAVSTAVATYVPRDSCSCGCSRAAVCSAVEPPAVESA